MKKIIISIILIFLALGCRMQNEINNKELIKAISNYVDLKSIPGKIVYTVKFSYEYDDYDLYRIGSFNYFFIGEKGENLYPNNIAKINGNMKTD